MGFSVTAKPGTNLGLCHRLKFGHISVSFVNRLIDPIDQTEPSLTAERTLAHGNS